MQPNAFVFQSPGSHLLRLLVIAAFLAAPIAAQSARRFPPKLTIKRRSWIERQAPADARIDAARTQYLAKKRMELEALLRTTRTEGRVRIGLELARDYMKEAKSLPYEQALPAWKRVVALCRMLTTEPTYPQVPEMLYLLGMAYARLGQDDTAEEVMVSLLRTYPGTPFADEADLFVGDRLFDRNALREAEMHFNAVLARGNRSVARYARFRHAWCAHNLGRHGEAIADFKTVINDESGETLGLREEALADIVLPFVDGNRTADAIAFYRSREPKEAAKQLERLAMFLVVKGRHGEAIHAWHAILDARIDTGKNYEIVGKIISAYYDSGALPRTIESLRIALSREVGKGAPAVDGYFETLTRTLASRSHSDGQKKIFTETSYESAKALYELYLDYFPAAAAAPELRVHLADIFTRGKDFLRAADLYRAASLAEKDAAKSEAQLRFALGALESALAATAERATIENKYVELADDYAHRFATSKYAPEIEATSGKMLYDRGIWAEAIPRLRESVKRLDGNRFHAAAAMLLDALNHAGQNDELVVTSSELLADRRFTGAEERQRVEDILRRTELQRIQGLEKEERHREAADAYLAFVESHGKKDRALMETALFNASVEYRKATLAAEAGKIELRLIEEFPESPRAKDLLLFVARDAEAKGDFETAAKLFDSFVRAKPTDQNVPSALQLAGLYHLIGGHPMPGERALQASLDRSPGSSALELGVFLQILRTSGDRRKERALHEARLKLKGVPRELLAFHTARLAELLSSSSDRVDQKRSIKLSATVLPLLAKGRTGEYGRKARAALGRMRLAEMKRTATEVEGISLHVPAKRMEKALARKLKLVATLERQAKSLNSIADPDATLGGWLLLSYTFRHLADATEKAPVPRGLSISEKTAYRLMVREQVVQPFLKKSLEFASRCQKGAEANGVLSDWLTACAEVVSSLDVEKPLVRTPLIGADLLAPLSSEDNDDRGSRTPIYAGMAPIPAAKAPRIAKSIASEETRILNDRAIGWVNEGKHLQAKLLWLVLVARGTTASEVLNNLGVASYHLGEDRDAENWFRLASTGRSGWIAERNLGFLALKYRNGREAALHFEKALSNDKAEPLCHVGVALAKFQQNDYAGGWTDLKALSERTPDAPHVKAVMGSLKQELEAKPALKERILVEPPKGDEAELSAAIDDNEEEDDENVE